MKKVYKKLLSLPFCRKLVLQVDDYETKILSTLLAPTCCRTNTHNTIIITHNTITITCIIFFNNPMGLNQSKQEDRRQLNITATYKWRLHAEEPQNIYWHTKHSLLIIYWSILLTTFSVSLTTDFKLWRLSLVHTGSDYLLPMTRKYLFLLRTISFLHVV